MQPRTTGLLLLVALALGAFIYFYEIQGEGDRLEAETRERHLFGGIEPGDVDWIETRTSDGAALRAEQAEGAWQITEPVRFAADAAVERMAETLAALPTDTTFENPGPDAEYGLDPESARIVRFGVGDESYELRLGKETPVGSGVYARTGADEAIHTVASYRNTAFARSLFDLREKQILDIDPAAVGEIEVRWPGGRVRLDRLPEGGEADPNAPEARWRMRSPLDARADDDAVDSLLSSLGLLRATGFVDAPDETQRGSLENPAFAVELRMRDSASPALSLAIGPGRDDDTRLVRAGGTTLFEIATERISDFPRETIAYRFRELAQFALTDATKLDFFFQSADGDPVVIQANRSDTGWEAQPEPFAPGKLARAVSELSGLLAEAILAESLGEEELAGLGLSPPHTIVSVFADPPEDAEEDAGAQRLAELHLGDVTPEGIVARAAGDPAVYRCPWT